MLKKKFTHFRIRMFSAVVLMLAGSVGLSEKVNAQVLINESFSTATGFTPPTGWTNTSLNASDPWDFSDACDYFNNAFSAGTTNMAGNIAILNTDCNFSDQSAELTTPTFNASGNGITILLEFDNSINNSDAQVCNVDVWNGTVWTSVFSVIGASDGAFDANHKSIDITAACGANTAAMVRFHYEGNNEYWWAIDNVKITKLSCVPPTATFTQTPNCAANQYAVNVNISSLGSATSINLMDGTTSLATITATGDYPLSPFTSSSTHNLVLVHNLNAGCNVSSIQTYICPAPNDLICDAITLVVDGPADCQNTVTATATDNPPGLSSCTSPNNNVWYKFTPSISGANVITITNPISGDALNAFILLYTVTDPCGTPSYTQIPFPNGGCQEGSSGVNGSTTYSLTGALTAGTEYYLILDGASGSIGSYCINVITAPPPPVCVTSIAPANAATNLAIYPNPPVFNWNASAGAISYEIYLGTSAGGESSIGTTTDTFSAINDLEFSTPYYWYVVPIGIGGSATGCETNEFSFTTQAQPAAPVNDDAPGAITLTVGAACSGSPYSNLVATLSTGEPYPSCNSTQSQGEHSMWFKFVAPTSGSVKITTDVGPLGTLTDSRIGLFSTTNVNDYTTFSLIGCDDDNGVVGSGYMSTIFTTDLVGGQTYYVEVDGYTSTTTGSYCVQVEEINPTMLSSTASCADLQTPLGDDAGYTGWVTLLDEAGKLVANVRNLAGGSVEGYEGSYNVAGNGFGTPRQDGNSVYYLSRNFMINNSSITTPVEVRFYFHPGEIATLAGVTGNATNLSNLNVTKQENTSCNADFDDANGTTSVLTQNANGVVNGVSWIQVTTSSFSNFYLMGGTTALTGTTVPLAIVIKSIAAKNIGKANQINWITAEESKGDYFELERSNNGRTFNFLAKVAANEKPSDYVYYDKSPLENVNYYRLKLISRDGKITYSQTVQATLSANGMFVDAYPNPTDKSVTVKVHGSENGDVTLSDVSGRVVYQTKMNGSELQIDMSKLSNGFYLIHYVDGSLNKVIKVNKQ